jgi:hypothetical protein
LPYVLSQRTATARSDFASSTKPSRASARSETERSEVRILSEGEEACASHPDHDYVVADSDDAQALVLWCIDCGRTVEASIAELILSNVPYEAFMRARIRERNGD